MAMLAELPRVGEVEAIQGNDALAGFSCGTEYVWEEALNRTVRRMAQTGGPSGTRAHLVEDESPGARGALIAVVLFFPWRFSASHPFPDLPEDAIYIQALGVSERYRKSLVPADDGETPVGAWLLDWTLEKIRSSTPGQMPTVWALVHQDNERCHRMLGGEDFGPYKLDSWEYEAWVRAPNPNQPGRLLARAGNPDRPVS